MIVSGSRGYDTYHFGRLRGLRLVQLIVPTVLPAQIGVAQTFHLESRAEDSELKHGAGKLREPAGRDARATP